VRGQVTRLTHEWVGRFRLGEAMEARVDPTDRDSSPFPRHPEAHGGGRAGIGSPLVRIFSARSRGAAIRRRSPRVAAGR
jgi:hypothetical protein